MVGDLPEVPLAIAAALGLFTAVMLPVAVAQIPQLPDLWNQEIWGHTQAWSKEDPWICNTSPGAGRVGALRLWAHVMLAPGIWPG